jgi:nitrile hydratase
LNDGYYGRWLGGAETLLVEAGLITQGELTARAVALGAPADGRVAARPSTAPDTFAEQQPKADEDRRGTAQREVSAAAKFSVGQRVRTASAPVAGHTRLPAYARSALGEVVAQHGAWVYPDTNAHGRGEQPQHLYTVAFAGEELWDGAGEAGFEVRLDLFEPYLSPV